MSSRREPQWIYWFPYAAMMAVFSILAVGFILADMWLFGAVSVCGILTTGMAWRTNQQLRDRIRVGTQQRVRDGYRIAELEAQLARARSWQN